MAFGSTQTVAESFTSAVAGTNIISVRANETFDFSISGTFVAPVPVQRRRAGASTWMPVEEHTAPMERVLRNAGAYDIRLECTAFTSGTAVCELHTAGERGV